MILIGRRHFCTAFGASVVGLAVVLVGCSSNDGNTSSAPPTTADAGGVLAGLSLQVRRDPG